MSIETYKPPRSCSQLVIGGKVVGHISLGGGMLLMPVGAKTVLFEMHHYFGPIPWSRRKDEALERIPKGFWDAYERWDKGGKLVDGELCVVPAWCEACKGTGDKLQHIGGNHWRVVGKCERCDGIGVLKEISERARVKE